jgi:hypothetical protein
VRQYFQIYRYFVVFFLVRALSRKVFRRVNIQYWRSYKRDVPVRCVLKNCLIFGPYRPETEICVLKENCKLKFKIDLDRHGPRPLLNDPYPAGPPSFSLYTTFKPHPVIAGINGRAMCNTFYHMNAGAPYSAIYVYILLKLMLLCVGVPEYL